MSEISNLVLNDEKNRKKKEGIIYNEVQLVLLKQDFASDYVSTTLEL